MEITIRIANKTDYLQVEKIMKQVQAMHTIWRPDIYKNSEPILPEDQFLDHIKKEQLLVAIDKNNQIVGILIYVTKMISGGPMIARRVLYIDSMGVDEKYRGKGIGHRLLDYIKLIYQQQHYDGIELNVNAKNQAARQMYAQNGFTEKNITMELI